MKIFNCDVQYNFRTNIIEYILSGYRHAGEHRHPVLIDDWIPALVPFGGAQGKLAHHKSPV
jgi:hypothetical protein